MKPITSEVPSIPMMESQVRTQPSISLVVLAWNNLDLTQRCVASLRRNTRASAQLIIVDNGSAPPAARFAVEAADLPILNPHNRGFAAGMNQGLAAATADVVAFINNDTEFPPGWDSDLLKHLDDPSVGIVAPAVTAAGNPVTVRDSPGDEVVRLLPFGEFPSGVVYLLRRETMTELGGWNENYPVASAEDLDLCFTVWANDLDVVLDTRTLIQHVSQASVRELPQREQLYANNLRAFLSRWSDPHDVPQLVTVGTRRFERNLMCAQVAIRWIERMLEARRVAADLRQDLTELRAQFHSASQGRMRETAQSSGKANLARRLHRKLLSWGGR